MGKLTNIEIYNALIDRSLTVERLGENGIAYRYFLPYGANPYKYYEEALDVQSVKHGKDRPSTSKTNYGHHYRPGQIQPIGDKRFFTYYQLNHMSAEELWKFLIELYIKEELDRYINYVLKRNQKYQAYEDL